jgi:xanthine/CO dehydrogenase XdhC/CoxF family maturation factor
MNHDHNADRDCLGMLIGTKVRYIGVLGPRSRTTRMLNELYLVAQDDPRLHAPIGLEIGAETPQEIALAMVAEIQSVLRHAPGSNLRDHVAPIHARAMPRISEAVDAVTPVAL